MKYSDIISIISVRKSTWKFLIKTIAHHARILSIKSGIWSKNNKNNILSNILYVYYLVKMFGDKRKVFL